MPGKILIIEDDKDMAMILAMRLSKAGFEVHTAQDAAFGVKEAHQFKPQLIILDLMLPAGGGFAVLDRLKLSTHTNQIPVFVLSGADADKKQKVLDLGVQQFIQKPYEFDILLAEIKKVIEPAS
jgi:DNA-binding response OmpR family regulator